MEFSTICTVLLSMLSKELIGTYYDQSRPHLFHILRGAEVFSHKLLSDLLAELPDGIEGGWAMLPRMIEDYGFFLVLSRQILQTVMTPILVSPHPQTYLGKLTAEKYYNSITLNTYNVHLNTEELTIFCFLKLYS